MTNETLIQFFHWYYPEGARLWRDFASQVSYLAELGITSAWLPPPYKAGSGAASVGYDAYDLFDLGEFNQQGTIATKYGTMWEFTQAIAAAHKKNIRIIADAVLNHKAHGDELEKITVRKVNPDNRTEFTSDPIQIDAWTKFKFPGRNKKYSEFVWDQHCFSGIDWAENLKEKAIFKILNEYGEEWEQLTEQEYGNFDFLNFADIEFRNVSVREELKYWGQWFLRIAGADGFRLDAVKHINPGFINEWTDHLNHASKKKLFYVGEYWNDHSAEGPIKFLEVTGGKVHLIDAPFHNNLYRACCGGRDFDLRNIFDNSLVQQRPDLSVLFVSNHDSQPLQVLEKTFADWFQPLAYALILLREAGIPCIFYPDLYGADYTGKGKDGNDYHIVLKKVDKLPLLLLARRYTAYGPQHDYLDHKNTIGWTREGIGEKRNSGCAVLLSNGDNGWKHMELGKRHAGKIFVDLLGNVEGELILDKKGSAEFHCKGGGVSVWVDKRAAEGVWQGGVVGR